MKAKDTVRQFEADCKTHQLIKSGDRIVVGVSGGVDSIVLLHLLLDLRYQFGLNLIVAHYNHQLRRTADRDQRFVEKLAHRHHLPFYTDTSQTLKAAKQGSIEELARKERLRFFEKLVVDYKAHGVALAHHKDDLAETVLMRIIRGTGLQGLRAIQPKTDFGRIMLIRPLLRLSKSDILAYAKHHDLDYKEDPTNQQRKYLRNRVRNELLPLLQKDYNPQVCDALVKFAETAADDLEYLEVQCDRAFRRMCDVQREHIQMDMAAFVRLHPSLQKMVLRRIYKHFCNHTKRLSSRNIYEAQDLLRHRPNHSIVDWPSKVSLQKTDTKLIFGLRNNP